MRAHVYVRIRVRTEVCVHNKGLSHSPAGQPQTARPMSERTERQGTTTFTSVTCFLQLSRRHKNTPLFMRGREPEGKKEEEKK